ncbi:MULTISPECIES: hypothetical protein [unclassified Sphingomonas]|uniref:hypothetical protein n=1 Tax=unclassified Sphingomonas TaxID=196159 RepID=UPI0028641E7C|nr:MULTISPECIES: hypothetical protein [unclassified Sphingomonas]MDR6115055.1 hypothetical protein [Sphingomonas sp. SORGH_AS_0789]MDR6151271.1 hypothetical protein [Sphingomonas sp. SORGH_AS_0742]
MKAVFGKSAAKRAPRPISHSYRRVAVRRRSPDGPGPRIERKTGELSRIRRWPAETPVSPAARKIIDGDVFAADGDLCQVEELLPSTGGAQADVLIIREWLELGERSACRALQVRDIEEMIVEERINFPFVCGAKEFNLSCGWGPGDRPLASVGIALGGDQ